VPDQNHLLACARKDSRRAAKCSCA
jgi:hypothetical protein